MASSKISDLTELLGLGVAADDLMQVIDVSDTTMGASGTNKKMLLGQFGGKFLIEEITLTSGAPGNFDFTSIPQMFNRLRIEGYTRGTDAAITSEMQCYMNNDTTDANYHSQLLYGDNGTSGGAEDVSARMGYSPGATSLADGYSSTLVVLEGYNTSMLKMLKAETTLFRTTSHITEYFATAYHKTLVAAITQLTVQATTGLGLYGTLRLYGEF